MEIKLSFTEKINRALDGRKQVWVVKKMNEILGRKKAINSVRFSVCKNGTAKFTTEELYALNSVINGTDKEPFANLIDYDEEPEIYKPTPGTENNTADSVAFLVHTLKNA